ncbi:MAG: response regulator [Cellvibrio sp.]
MPNNILIVEDEPELGQILRDYLSAENFSVTISLDGESARERIEKETFQLIILDLMLPKVDGLTLCKEIRKKSSIPIVMTTAKVEEIDRLLGLEIGADDYICKPYSPREVVARVKAVLRRSGSSMSEPSSTLILNKDSLEVSINNKICTLTLIEFRLLQTLWANKHKIVSRELLLANAYDDHRVVSDRTMDSHITKLRKKLAEIYDGDPIQSVYGAGYRLQI